MYSLQYSQTPSSRQPLRNVVYLYYLLLLKLQFVTIAYIQVNYPSHNPDLTFNCDISYNNPIKIDVCEVVEVVEKCKLLLKNTETIL